MSNANRDYAIVYDVKNSLLVLSRPLIFYLTDKNTSNIFVKLVKRVIVGNGIDQYADIENASSYVLTMRVIKPDDEVKSIIATQHESESIFQFDLTEDFKDIPGKYICELTISNIVNGRQEFITSDPFNYEVKRSILSNVKNIIEGKDTTVEKLLNDLDATKAELSSRIKEEANATKAELSSQIKEKANNLQGQINNLVINGTGDSNPEVVQARGKYNILNDRLNTHEDNINVANSSLEICKQEISKLNEKLGYDTKKIVLEKNSTYTIPSNVESQTVELLWDGDVAEGDSAFFKNGADNVGGKELPYTLPQNTHVQILDTWGKTVGAYSYDNKGTDNYGTCYGYIYISVVDNDSIEAQSGTILNLDGTNAGTITQSGFYALNLGTITSNSNFVNRGFIKSTNGKSVLTNVVLQSKAWIRENHNINISNIKDFIDKFPVSKIGNLKPGDSYVPTKQASAKINNTTNINGKTLSLEISSNMIIECTLGSLTFSYKIEKGTSSGSEEVQSFPWADYKWACIGDSYTDTTINANYKYEQIIHDLTGIQVQMLGVGSTGWRKGYDTQTSYRFRAAQVAADTDIVTIFGSINDWSFKNPGNALTVGTKDDSLSNNDNTLCAYINDVFDALEEAAPTAQVVVFSPMYYHGLTPKVQELFDAVKVCTENRGYEFVDMLNTGWLRIEKNATYAQKYCTDYDETREAFGHPNNDAHKQFIAPKFFSKLKEYLPISKNIL